MRKIKLFWKSTDSSTKQKYEIELQLWLSLKVKSSPRIDRIAGIRSAKDKEMCNVWDVYDAVIADCPKIAEWE